MTLPIGNVPQIPFQLASGGLRTELGTFTPPGGRVVAYVHHLGAPRLADITAATTVPNVCKTLNEALRQCQSGWGDTVLVLPGHAENISSADQMSALVAGTRIIGLGNGNNRPTFTWTAAAATFLLDVANVRIENCILNMDPGAGTVNVAAPMTVSAAGCQLVNCKMRMGTDANSKVTIGITTTAAGDDLEIINCDIYGAAASAITTGIRLVGADRLRLINTIVNVGTSADAVGAVQCLTTASLDILVSGCVFNNSRATSTAAFTGMAGITGLMEDTSLAIGGATGAGAGFTTRGAINIGKNVVHSTDDGSAALPLS